MSDFNQETNTQSAQLELIKSSVIRFHYTNKIVQNRSEEEDRKIENEIFSEKCPDAQTENKEDLQEKIHSPLKEEEDLQFGVFELEIAQTPMTQEELDITSTNDISASMSDACKDGRTKMQHLHLTLENIIRLLSSNSEKTKVNLEITGFDDSIVQVLDPTKITSDPATTQEIINAMKNKLYPRGSTNIHLALQDASTRISDNSENPAQQSHIFMTDGIITSGTSDIETLKKAVPQHCQNYFIGFGSDHDFRLLQQLAESGSGSGSSSYYYVDKIENAGLVFGEIIHNILYTALRNVTIKVTNGEIYDFQSNQWLTEISVPNLCGEAKKTFHIRSKTPYDLELTLSGLDNKGNTISHTEIAYPPLLDAVTRAVDKDYNLTKFMYRQKVLELLHQSTIIATNIYTTSEEKAAHQEKMKCLRKEIEAYSSTQEEDNKSYLKQLTDDLYISEKTLHSDKALLYTTVRQNAQGRETSYNMTQIDKPSLRKQPAYNVQQDVDDDYNVAVNPLSRAYTSSTQAQVMRSCSANTGANAEDEDEYEETDPHILEMMRLQQEEDARIARENTTEIQRSSCIQRSYCFQPDEINEEYQQDDEEPKIETITRE